MFTSQKYSPFSLWLLFARRHDWMPLTAVTYPSALLWLLACAFAWGLGELAGVSSVKEYASVGLLIASFALLFGKSIFRVCAIPLMLLFFMVPFGDFLVPSMMELTARFAVQALRLTGLPVYQEGMHIITPSGHWSVIEACAGLRYLIASFVLGVLYAYLTYRSTVKRVIFIAISIVVPVLANWVRAYLIILAGHLSDMKIAADIDHLIYGWLFFGLVAGMLFWFGQRWRDASIDEQRGSAVLLSQQVNSTLSSLPAASIKESESGARQALMAAIGIAIALAAVLAVKALQARTTVVPFDQICAQALATVPDASVELGFKSNWKLAVRSWDGVKQSATGPISISARYYAQQHLNGEMIRWGNFTIANDDETWLISQKATLAAGKEHEVREIIVRTANGQSNLLIWEWFLIAGTATTSEFAAKMLTARALISGHGDGSAVYVVATPINDDLQRARLRLGPIAQTLTNAGQQALRR